MAFETKEQVLEKILTQDKPKCPHCNQEMNLWEVPPVNFSDGLGWGVPYLYLCFNDECSLYKSGWQDIEYQYGYSASCRCLCYPGTETYENMPVFSPVGAQGQIIDDQVLLEQEILKENIKKGFSILADCYIQKDSVAILKLLLDSTQPSRVRLKAAEMIGDIGELEAVEPIKNVKFGNEKIQETVNAAISKIHARNFTRECPFCAEIIKQRAKICKHCKSDVAGK
jgi:hypothetical protein